MFHGFCQHTGMFGQRISCMQQMLLVAKQLFKFIALTLIGFWICMAVPNRIPFMIIQLVDFMKPVRHGLHHSLQPFTA